MEPLEYLHVQMRLEGLGLGAGGLLTRLEPDAEALPLILLARTQDGRAVRYFGGELPPGARQALLSLEDTSRFPDAGWLVEALRVHGVQSTAGHYRTYIFPPQYAGAPAPAVSCLPRADPRVLDFGFGGLGDEVYAVVGREGLLSACVSSRQNTDSAEAWVVTRPECRGQGLARRVTAAWAGGVLRAGRNPFYSHKIENQPSARLAAALGLIPVFEEVVIERAG